MNDQNPERAGLPRGSSCAAAGQAGGSTACALDIPSARRTGRGCATSDSGSPGAAAGRGDGDATNPRQPSGQRDGRRAPVQAKLIVNAPGDQYELEADRMTEAVMRGPPVAPTTKSPVAARSTVRTMTKPPVEPGGDGSQAASEAFAQRLEARRGRGRPLPPALRETFETRFGANFSGVRVHSDVDAGQLSNAIQAQAFTHGSDVYWGAGASGADTLAGKRLLAHELAHVVQQGAASVSSATAPQSVIQPKAGAGPSGLFASGERIGRGTWRPSTLHGCPGWCNRSLRAQYSGRSKQVN